MNYLIILDTTQLQFNFKDVHRFITTSASVTDWFHYLPSMYIITTNLTVDQISNSFVSNYPGLRHFVINVELKEMNGLLPNEAWKWLQNKTRSNIETAPSAPAKQPSIQDLLSRLTEFEKNKK